METTLRVCGVSMDHGVWLFARYTTEYVGGFRIKAANAYHESDHLAAHANICATQDEHAIPKRDTTSADAAPR